MSERSPRGKETLIFATPQEAQAWREVVAEKVAQQRKSVVRQDKEIVGQAVQQEFNRQGEAVGMISHPWEHTSAEHEEVQGLVDMAFEADLPAALKAARQSPHYPRNMDLFHDLLTSEMYKFVREGNLTQQPLGLWIIEAAAILLTAALGVLVFLLLAR